MLGRYQLAAGGVDRPQTNSANWDEAALRNRFAGVGVGLGVVLWPGAGGRGRPGADGRDRERCRERRQGQRGGQLVMSWRGTTWSAC